MASKKFLVDIDLSSNRIENLGAPVSKSDAVSKQYVDQLVSSGIQHQNPAISIGENEPPGTPTGPDRFVVGPAATGAWAGHDNEIAEWDVEEGVWVFTPLAEGQTLWIEESDARYTWTGTAWVRIETLSDLQAGDGLTKTGNTLDVDLADGGGLAVEGGQLRIADEGVGTEQIEPEAITAALLASDIPVSTFTGAIRRHAESVGDATNKAFTIGHGFSTRDVIVQVFRNTTPYDQVEATVEHTSTTEVTVSFEVIPTTNQYRVVVLG